MFLKYRIWIKYFVNQEGGGCMVAPPLLVRIFKPKKCLFCSIDSQCILERVMIFQGCPIKGKLTTVYHHGCSHLLHLFRPWFFSFHSNSMDIKALYHWQGVAFTGSFLCKYAKHFKGERSLRRHICPVCNQVIQTSFAFVFIVNHWIINQFIIRNGWPSVIMFASWAWRHYDVTHVPNVNKYLSRLH